MPDLNELLRGVDRVTAPDEWDAIRARSTVSPRPPNRAPAIVVGLAVAAIALGVVWFAFRDVGSGRPTATPHENGPILITGRGPSSGIRHFINTDVFRLDPATGSVVNVTATPLVAESSPVWSPDGTRVVFHRTMRSAGEGVVDEIAVADADFSHPDVLRRCSDGCGTWDIAWSPDDTHLAWVTDVRIGRGSVMALQVVDLETRRRTTVCDSRTCGFPGQPTWSPDGEALLFSDSGIVRIPGLIPPAGPIWVADASTWQIHPLTDAPTTCNIDDERCVFDSGPRWSPDGSSIAFVRATGWGRPEATIDVVVMNADGSGERRLSRCASNDRCRLGPLAWGPFGRVIAFVDRYDAAMLRFVRVDGSGRSAIALPPGAADVWGLEWSPDGRTLALLSDGSLRLVDARTGVIKRLGPPLPDAVEDLQWLPASVSS